MAYLVELPDGRAVEFEDSVPKEEAARIIRQQLGMEMPGAQKRTGFGAALATGFEGLVDPTITAGQAAFGDANKAAEEALKRAANSPYASQVSWDKVKEKFNTEGVLAAAAEVARQAPLALTEQVPQLAATLGGAYAGAKAGALTSPVTGPVGPIAGGLLGAVAATAPATFGSNLIRQAAEQQERGEAVDVNVPAAAGAAAVSTALDTAATFIPLGRRVVRGVFGPQVDALFKQGKTEAAEALARESLAKTLGKGVALGVAVEAPTEVVQSALERLQAGLPLLDEDALREYGESAYAGALVGGPLGAAGRAYGRSGARAEAREQEEAAAAEQRRAAARVEQEQREAPDYILTLNDEYQKLLVQKNALEGQLKKGTKEAPLTQEDKDNNELINRQLKEIKTPLERARQEFLGAGGNPALKKAREKTLDLTPPPPEAGAVVEEETAEEKTARLQRELPGLERLLEQRLRDLASATTPEESIPLAQRAAQARKALEDARSGVPVEPTVDTAALEKRIKGLEKKYEDARQKGDEAVVLGVVPELLSTRKELLAALDKQAAARPDTGLFDPAAIAAEDARRTALAEEIGALREAAEAKRPPSLTAQLAQQREADRRAREREELEMEGQAEREGMQGLAQDLAGRQRVRRDETLRREQQFEMFPERVQRIERTAETAKEAVPTPREGARAQVIERPAADVVSLRRQLAEQYRELRKLTRTQREAGAAPIGAEGPYSQLGPLPDTTQRIEGTKQRIEALEQQLNARMQPAVTTTTVGAPAERPQVSTRPKGPLDERIRAMAQRIQSSAQVDEDTKALVAEVADNLPGYLRQAERTAPDAARRTAEWMYRTLTGRPDAQALDAARGVLRDIEEGRRSETERLPSGEERRAVQQEFPEMPEPRATAFGSYAEFYNYLVTQAPILVGKDGVAALSVVRMQAELEPLKAQIAGLNAKETALNTEIAALEGQVGAARAAAQRRVELARADLAAARNELESDFEQVLALRDLAQQRYAQTLDAATESARALGDHTRALMAAMEAEKTEEVPAFAIRGAAEDTKEASALVPGTQYRISSVGDTDFTKLGAADNKVGTIFTATAAGTGSGTATIARPTATVFKGGAQRRAALRAAREKVEAALDEWMKAETYKRDVVQRNIGKDWSETSTTFAEYSLAKRQLDAARKKLQGAKNALNNVSTQAKVFSPLSDADLQNYLDREAELYNAFEAQMRRLSRQSGALQKAAQQTNLEKFIQQREAAHQALLKALARPDTDITAALKGYRASIDAAATRTKDELKLYGGTQAQFDAFDRAQENYAAAQESLAQFADSVQGTREQVTKLQKAAQELRTGAAALRKELRTKQSLIEARKTPPAPPLTTERADRAERERASAEAAQAEQARMERMEALPREVITFDRAKELVASNHPKYERLTGVMYDTSLPLEERAAAAKAADEFLQARQDKRDATQNENLRKAMTHVNGVTAAQKEVEGLRQKLEKVKLTVDQQRKLKNDPAAAAAALEERKAKVRAALANAEERLTGHRRKLAAALGFNKPTHVDPAQLRKDREALFSGVLEKRGVRALERGERLGPRAVGPVTRPEVFAPREMRTGSEESRAGETTTQPDTRLKEALGVRQRDVPITSVETAESNVESALINLERAQNSKQLREAIAQKEKVEAAIAEKGASTYRKRMLKVAEALVAERELPIRIAEKVLEERQISLEIAREGSTVARRAALTKAQGEVAELVQQQQKATASSLKTARNVGAAKVRSMRAVSSNLRGEADSDETPALDSFVDRQGDVFFSRGETAAPSTTATVRAELGKVFPDLGRVQIYDSVDALVQANPQYKGRIPADARGFVDSAGNKAFLIAENIDQGRALGVLLHEVGSHIGLKNTLGDAQYNALVKAVQTWAKKTDGSPEAKVAQAALARVEAAQTPASQRADETLAYAIEEAVNAGVKPMETKSVLGQWLSRVAQLFRRALEKFGLPPKALDAQGLVDMAFGAAKMEMRGQGAAAPTGRRELFFAKDAEQTTFYSGPIVALGPIKNPTADLWTDGESILLQIYDQDLINEGVKPSKAQVETVELEIKDNGKTAALHTYGVRPSASATLSKYKDQLTKVKAEGGKRDPYYKFNAGAFSVTDLRKLFRVVRDQAIDLRMFDNVEKVEIRRATGATAGMPPRFIEREDALRFSRKTDYTPGLADAEERTTRKAPKSRALQAAAELAEKETPELEIDFGALRTDDPMTPKRRATAPVVLASTAPSTKPIAAANPEAAANTYAAAKGFTRDRTSALDGVTFADAARFGAGQTSSPLRKALFNRLAEVFDAAPKNFGVGRVYATDGRPSKSGAQGMFAGRVNIAFVPAEDTAGAPVRVLLHELVHAATFYALSADPQLAAQIDGLRQRAVEWVQSREGRAYLNAQSGLSTLFYKTKEGKKQVYGLVNVDEFLAELNSNRDFQKLLAEIPSDKPKKSIFTRFVESIAAFLKLPKEAEQSLLVEAFALSDEVMQRTKDEVYSGTASVEAYQRKKTETELFSRAVADYTPGLATAGKVSEQLVGGQRSFVDKVKANLLGFRAQVVDKLAPLEKVAYANMDDMKASQLMFYMRMYDQRNHFTSEALATGVPERKEITRADGRREFVIESKPGANIKQIVDRLSTKAVVKAAGSVDAANRLFTLYTAAKRADRVGYQKLGFGRAAAEAELRQIDIDLRAPTLDPNDRKRLTQRKDYLEKNVARMPSEADIRAAVKEIEADKTLRDAFEDAREMYNEYNRNLLSFAVQAGAVSDAEAKRLLAAKDYVPYYRVRGGNAELVIGGENPIRIGNLKDNPQLEELVGGEEPIFDFLTSSVQNTSMLLDMSLRNMAVKNAMWELRDVGLAKVYSVRNEKGKRRSVPDNAVKFRVKGEDWFAVVNTDAAGVPSDLLVKGLAGIPTMLPAAVRMMAVPARILRRAIVASPVYVARQVVRDSVSAALASGANMTPILSSLRKIGKKGALDARGVTGGQVFTGMPEDMARLLREMQTGRPGWAKAWSMMERTAMEADATTRRAQYDSYREQGLSEMEATLAALESMNFSRRGLSPSVHFANAIIPFFNAQIQGLDVLYRSLRGQMPFDKRLDIRNKLLTRGALLAGMSLAYAASMQDEEEYKNARPDEKYGNWFLRMPFLDEYADEPVVVRVPVPFELGYIFKSLPEALVNTMASEEGGKEALQALKQIAINTIPGGSSMPQLGGMPVPVPLPAAVKPLIEVSLGRSFFTGRDIESVQEQQLEPGARSRDSTSEVAKAVGETFNISPVKMEYLIRGYTGSLGVALMQSLNFLAPAPEGSEKALKRMSELPVVGTVFQPMDAGGIIDAAYARVNEIRQAQETYEDMLTKGRTADAQAYLERKADELSAASVAGDFRKRMGDVTKAERAIREAPSLSAQEKRERLNELRQVKIQIASAARAIFDRKTPQAAPA